MLWHALALLCRFSRYLTNIDDFGGLGEANYELETFVKYDIQHSDKYSRKRHTRWWPGPSLRTAAVQGSGGWEEANCNAIQEKYDFHKIGKYGLCSANKYCSTTCATEIASVRRQPSAGEEGGDCCSVPVAHQIGRSTISNITGNSWGLPIHLLRVVWLFLMKWGWRFAPPSWDRLDRPHCIRDSKHAYFLIREIQMKRYTVWSV